MAGLKVLPTVQWKAAHSADWLGPALQAKSAIMAKAV